ncbi:universal stress protein [Kineococcus indalonis]|uniref:universal stress protein n=1 Tax=Kineococcus indalonis TaxID=2696566 RepID=UPI0014130C08|nr:universal stress protein [Kineococcus indalonis]NAZ86324.1 universal stress protein [Kineococcus indalonis]
MSRRYLVAHDGGERGTAALRLGAVLAASLGAELDVVLVVRSDDPFGQPYPPVGDVTGLVAEQARRWLDEALAQLPAGVPARGHLRTAASVPEGLLEAVEELAAAAVVVGATGGANPFGVGPVARALLHSSPVPVVLAPQDGAGPAAPGRLEHLYAAVGTRPGATAVLEEAAEAAERTGLPLHVVSLLEVDARSGAEEPALDRLREVVERTRLRLGDGLVSVELGKGRTMAEAVASIDWEPGGLLLVGSSRLARGRQTFLGPTAARMLRHVPVPVAVVPRGER